MSIAYLNNDGQYTGPQGASGGPTAPTPEGWSNNIWGPIEQSPVPGGGLMRRLGPGAMAYSISDNRNTGTRSNTSDPNAANRRQRSGGELLGGGGGATNTNMTPGSPGGLGANWGSFNDILSQAQNYNQNLQNTFNWNPNAQSPFVFSGQQYWPQGTTSTSPVKWGRQGGITGPNWSGYNRWGANQNKQIGTSTGPKSTSYDQTTGWNVPNSGQWLDNMGKKHGNYQDAFNASLVDWYKNTVLNMNASIRPKTPQSQPIPDYIKDRPGPTATRMEDGSIVISHGPLPKGTGTPGPSPTQRPGASGVPHGTGGWGQPKTPNTPPPVPHVPPMTDPSGALPNADETGSWGQQRPQQGPPGGSGDSSDQFFAFGSNWNTKTPDSLWESLSENERNKKVMTLTTKSGIFYDQFGAYTMRDNQRIPVDKSTIDQLTEAAKQQHYRDNRRGTLATSGMGPSQMWQTAQYNNQSGQLSGKPLQDSGTTPTLVHDPRKPNPTPDLSKYQAGWESFGNYETYWDWLITQAMRQENTTGLPWDPNNPNEYAGLPYTEAAPAPTANKIANQDYPIPPPPPFLDPDKYPSHPPEHRPPWFNYTGKPGLQQDKTPAFQIPRDAYGNPIKSDWLNEYMRNSGWYSNAVGKTPDQMRDMWFNTYPHLPYYGRHSLGRLGPIGSPRPADAVNRTPADEVHWPT